MWNAKEVMYIAKSKISGRLIFVRLGEKYDQQEYELLLSLEPEDVLKLVRKVEKVKNLVDQLPKY